MISGVKLQNHSDGGWTVYLFRADGTGMSCAYSVNYPGVSGESVAGSWVEFLGLAGFEVG